MAITPKETAYGVAGIGFSVLGGLLKGMADIQSGGYNATVSRQNARLDELAAGDAELRGHAAAAFALIKGSQMEGKQKSAMAGANVSVTGGSALDVLSDTKFMSDLDAKTIQNNATREAWGYRTAAQNLKSRANLEEGAGRSQATSDILSGITGAATYGSKMIGIA